MPQDLSLKRMGVMNVTPNSFSDGGELSSAGHIVEKLQKFGPIDALDVGAESTAPMNSAIDSEEEWKRLSLILPIIKNLECALSVDTYHPETIFKVAEIWKEGGHKSALIWNDVSGKFDDHVKRFLNIGENFHYVFCHNLAPIRELTGRHMEYLSVENGEDFLNAVASYLRPAIHPRVIFDPCLGFSKTYEQNWLLFDRFGELQKRVGHHRWLLGFSRKSFLRKKHGLEITDRDKLDQLHQIELKRILGELQGEVWVRTHRPELL